MDNTIHIAFCFDQNYSMPCGVSITSICENTPGPICFHALIAGNVTDDAKDKIRKVTGSHGNQVFYYKRTCRSSCTSARVCTTGS